MKITIYGLDLAKCVMQLHWVDWDTGEIHRKQVRRGKLLEFFVNREPEVIAMEACGSAHYWARELGKLGHEARLIAAQFVRPFVKTNKNDAADAAAIWEAVQRPDMRFVAVKSEEQQSVLTLHRVREQLIKIRTMQINAIRGVDQRGKMNRMRAKSAIQLNTLLGGRSVALPVIYQVSKSKNALLACVQAWTLMVVQLMTLINTLAMVLVVLGETERLARLVDVSTDDLGLALSVEALPKRVRSPRSKAVTNTHHLPPDPDDGVF